MAAETTRLTIQIAEENADPHELEDLTARLRTELLEIDVVTAQAERGAPPPPGARAVLSFSLGGLVVSIAGTELLAAVVGAVTAWLTRDQRRSAKLTIDGDAIELTGVPSAEQRRLTDLWGARGQRDGRRVLHRPCPGRRAAAALLLPRREGRQRRAVLRHAHHQAEPPGGDCVSAEFVSRRMSRSRSRRMILLLDCCYAGAWARGALPRAGMGVHVEEQFGGHGRVVITASNAMEYAFDGTELADAQEQAPSVFTRALVEGLESGDADRDQDGYVGIDELYDYVYDQVRQTTPGQTPGKWAFDLQGDLHVARRARPVTVPSPLPAELQAVIENSLPRVRAGAAEELRRLLRSRHEGLALAARLALQELADDDSRTVSTAAAEALATGGTTAPASPSGPPPPAPMSQFPHSVPVSPEPEPSQSAPPATSVRATTGEPAPTAPTDDRADPVPGVAADPGTGAPSAAARTHTHVTPPTTPSPVGQQASSVSETATAESPDARGYGGDPEPRPPSVPVTRPSPESPVSALPAAFLLASAALSWLSPAAAIWQWLLVAAALGAGLLPPEGRAREIALGFAAGLSAVMLGLLTFYAEEYSSGWSVWIAATGTLLIFAVVMLEGAPGTTRWSWLGERTVGLIAVTVIAAHLASPERITDDPGKTLQWWGATVVVVACLCLFVVRGIEQRRDARALVAFVLGAAATVLVVLDLGSAVRTVYLPTVLVMLLLGVRPARGRPEFLAAARLSLIAGVLQGVADHGP
ncbi:UNVERIFIED_ORG: putative membrane protein [Microbispora rosea subsp. rosea]